MSELGKLRRKDNCGLDECPVNGGCSYTTASSRLNCTPRRSHDRTVGSGSENGCHSIKLRFQYNNLCSVIIFSLALFPYNHVLHIKSDYSSYRTCKMHALHTHAPTSARTYDARTHTHARTHARTHTHSLTHTHTHTPAHTHTHTHTHTLFCCNTSLIQTDLHSLKL